MGSSFNIFPIFCFSKMPQSEPLNPAFPILSPFSCHIPKKDQGDCREDGGGSDPLRPDRVFRGAFHENLWP